MQDSAPDRLESSLPIGHQLSHVEFSSNIHRQTYVIQYRVYIIKSTIRKKSNRKKS